jgi:hypothetical protein
MHDAHLAFVRELPQHFETSSDSDLDGTLGIHQTGLYCIAKGASMVQSASGKRLGSIAMSIEMHKADFFLRGNGFEDRECDGVIPSGGYGKDACGG